MRMTSHPIAERLVIFGTSSGGVAIDQDDFGGNPFATALIELSNQPNVNLRNLPAKLQRTTIARTQGVQRPDFEPNPRFTAWQFARDPSEPKEQREALVLVVSDYTSVGLQPLAGAEVDERRISSMLAAHGFSVRQGVGPTRRALLDAQRRFAKESQKATVALIYCTGHGIELDGQVFLLPGDYPFDAGYARRTLLAHAIPIETVSSSCNSHAINLIFFAGCRKHAVRQNVASQETPSK